ncbi:MAG: DUF4388 domain-containing protein [Deltaproteobacteria bacterium]|nr:DUF4388 domain-containing protein [Deltaproteobacteria bacterium]
MGVKGRLRDMSLIDVIQIFNAERRTAAIHLGGELGYGTVYMDSGNIVHAAHRDLKGAEAFYQLLAWQDGEFEVEPDIEAPEQTITEPPESVILEGLRRLDEGSRGKGSQTAAYAGDMDSIRLINRLLDLKILEKI